MSREPSLFLDLLVSLAWRDIRVRYKQSMLGMAWAVLLPLSMMLVFTLVFARAVNASGADLRGTPYALYAFAGLVPWTFFSMSLSSCVNSLVANRNLVTKVYFPREVFPFSCVLSSLVDFAVAMVILVVLIIAFTALTPFSYSLGAGLLIYPIVLLIQIVLTTGLGLMLSMANLFYRDVRQVFSVAIQLLMFVSAVVIPLPDSSTTMGRVLMLNPLAHLMQASRDCLLYGQVPDAYGLCFAAVVAISALAVGWTVFRKASYRFAECI